MDDLLDESVTVATGLQALNETLELQRQSIAKMTEQLMSATIGLATRASAMVGDENAYETGDQRGQATPADNGNAAPELDDDEPNSTSTLGSRPTDAPAWQALAQAYHNTVATQRQLNIIAEAALTEGISLLYTTVGEALGNRQAQDATKT